MVEIIELINQNTFPIIACVGLGMFINQMIKGNREDSKMREQKLFDQLAKNSETMDKFNEVLKSMDTRLSNIEEKVGE